jgi:CDGSH-type Zn-finger protein
MGASSGEVGRGWDGLGARIAWPRPGKVGADRLGPPPPWLEPLPWVGVCLGAEAKHRKARRDLWPSLIGDSRDFSGSDKMKITVTRDGSLKVEGDVKLLDHEGKELETREGKATFLCRCGHSRNKPYCDMSHKSVGFDGTLAG